MKKLWTTFIWRLTLPLNFLVKFMLVFILLRLVSISALYYLWNVFHLNDHLFSLVHYIPSLSSIWNDSTDFPDYLSIYLSIYPYNLSLPVGLLDYILCLHRAAVGKFRLVGQHWQVHVKDSIRERHLWVCPSFLSRVPHLLIVLFWWF